MVDLIVVGGGIIGMLTARELALAGLRVKLLERGQVGHESSWAGGGILSPLYPWRYAPAVTRLARWSQQHYVQLAGELKIDGGIDPEYTPSGLLMLDMAGTEIEQAMAWAKQYDYKLERIRPGQLTEIQRGLGEPKGDALWMAEVAQIRNPRLIKALQGSLVSLGVQVLEGMPVDEVVLAAGRVDGVRSGGVLHQAPQVVICGGAWTEALAKSVGLHTGIYPVKGQMLLFRAEPGLLQRIVLAEGHYLIPRRDGHILVGSTMEDTGFDKEVTVEAREELEAAAAMTLPGLAECPVVQHWAGLRPGRKDGIPAIAGHPSISGLYVNAGQFRNGVVTAPASAHLLADLVLGREPILDSGDYRL